MTILLPHIDPALIPQLAPAAVPREGKLCDVATVEEARALLQADKAAHDAQIANEEISLIFCNLPLARVLIEGVIVSREGKGFRVTGPKRLVLPLQQSDQAAKPQI